MTPYLTRTELRELTGRKTRTTVAAWLRVQRWRYVLDADEWPKVARAYHDQRMGLAGGAPAGTESEPDFSSLKRVA